jgi:DNA-binding MarR family transcriptional regulator
VSGILVGFNHNGNLNETIAVSLEIISRVFRTLLWDQAKREKLSPIQMQFLLFLSSHTRRFTSVSELSRVFQLTPPTVSDAVKSLEKKGLLQRMVSRQDKRKFPLLLTPAGSKLVKKLFNWQDTFLTNLNEFPDRTRETVSVFLLQLLESLNETHLLDGIRTCFSCSHFQNQSSGSEGDEGFCVLRKVSLNGKDLRLNCPNYRTSAL